MIRVGNILNYNYVINYAVIYNPDVASFDNIIA